ncbi:hypothetical protein AAG570_009027 [Ranatra chinensis]|uniref:Uncharacterized protein n=1 Tax=Ranatra chinensis TaxID=642074 RepID=A0ABD0YT81_9HEMI
MSAVRLTVYLVLIIAVVSCSGPAREGRDEAEDERCEYKLKEVSPATLLKMAAGFKQRQLKRAATRMCFPGNGNARVMRTDKKTTYGTKKKEERMAVKEKAGTVRQVGGAWGGGLQGLEDWSAESNAKAPPFNIVVNNFMNMTLPLMAVDTAPECPPDNQDEEEYDGVEDKCRNQDSESDELAKETGLESPQPSRIWDRHYPPPANPLTTG